MLDILGTGHFGEVQKGLYTDERSGAKFLVAVKSLHLDDSLAQDALLREAALMAQFRHEHIIGSVQFPSGYLSG